MYEYELNVNVKQIFTIFVNFCFYIDYLCYFLYSDTLLHLNRLENKIKNSRCVVENPKNILQIPAVDSYAF